MDDYYIEGEEKFGKFTTSFYNIIAWRMLKKLYNFTLEEMNTSNPGTILDIGAGPGKLTVMVANKFPKAKIYAIDPSKYMVETEKNNFKKANINAQCSLGSSRNIPFENNFDLIFSSLSFHHWKEKEKSLEIILNKLNLNGNLIIIEFLNDYYKSNISPYKKHSLSKKDVELLNFDGFEKTTDIKNNFIALKFKRLV